MPAMHQQHPIHGIAISTERLTKMQDGEVVLPTSMWEHSYNHDKLATSLIGLTSNDQLVRSKFATSTDWALYTGLLHLHPRDIHNLISFASYANHLSQQQLIPAEILKMTPRRSFRQRGLMAIETTQGPQIATVGHVARTLPGLYAEARRTGNRRLRPLQQLEQQIKTVNDYDSMTEAMNWLTVKMLVLHQFQFSPQPFGRGLQLQADIFEDLFEAINLASFNGQLSEAISSLSSLVEIFKWVVKLLEHNNGYSPPSARIYNHMIEIVLATLPLLISFMPNGATMALDLLRYLHRVVGKDTGEVATIILSMDTTEITLLYQTAVTIAQLNSDILALKVVQLLSFRVYPPQIQWMVDLY
ncbi:hypothetical protein BJ878DRAFT_572965 [Calycina marina]|uniref:Uncharacterized protein n=1 Tax=Calycina marina TaxID=1763456 RepID=A0A9P7ZA39_9HELO|nr:hypothetical protein BJ878DRAFT_572965 [Calycina marina]